MHVMNLADAGYTGRQAALHVVAVEPLRCTFQQHMCAALHQRPGAFQDQTGNRDRQDRIDQCPARIDDDKRGNDRGDGAQQVARDVQCGAPNIQVLLIAAVQHRKRDDVYDQPGDSYCKHRRTQNRDRMQETDRLLRTGSSRQSPADSVR